MNEKRAKSLRRITKSEEEYKELKRAWVKSRIGQNAKFKVERSRKPKEPIPPTWPRTKNQKLQSRPMIVERPVRWLIKALNLGGREAELYRQTLSKWPKCHLDLVILEQQSAD